MAMAGSERVGELVFPRIAWGAVIAGVLLALAAHVLLGLAGAALGLAAGSVRSGGLAVAAGFWGLLTPLVATLLGAWLACRLAGAREQRATNLLGVMVWCIGILAGALFLSGGAASGAMTAGAAAGGEAGTVERMMGSDAARGRAEAGPEAAGAAARLAGAGAMAGLCGLLGAFAGAAVARSRGEGRGLGFRLAIERTAHRRAAVSAPTEFPDRAYPAQHQQVREVERTEGPGAPGGDPLHH